MKWQLAGAGSRGCGEQDASAGPSGIPKPPLNGSFPVNALELPPARVRGASQPAEQATDSEHDRVTSQRAEEEALEKEGELFAAQHSEEGLLAAS